MYLLRGPFFTKCSADGEGGEKQIAAIRKTHGTLSKVEFFLTKEKGCLRGPRPKRPTRREAQSLSRKNVGG